MKSMLEQLPLKMSEISKKALKIGQMVEKLEATVPLHSPTPQSHSTLLQNTTRS